MNYKIALIKGDGIGPEIVDEAVKVLNQVGEKYGHTFDYTRVLMGGESIDACGVPLTDDAIAQCKASDSVLMGFYRRQYDHITMVQTGAIPSSGGWFAEAS